jgi:hypothetical protein
MGANPNRQTALAGSPLPRLSEIMRIKNSKLAPCAVQMEKDTMTATPQKGHTVTLVFGLLGAALALSAWASFVTYKLYGWFVVPLGAPVLNWWHVWGLLILFGLVTYKSDGTELQERPTPRTSRAIGFIITRVLVITAALLFGWLFHGMIA